MNIDLKKEILILEDKMVSELATYSKNMKNIRQQLEALREKCAHEDKHVYPDGSTECNICGKVL